MLTLNNKGQGNQKRDRTVKARELMLNKYIKNAEK